MIELWLFLTTYVAAPCGTAAGLWWAFVEHRREQAAWAKRRADAVHARWQLRKQQFEMVRNMHTQQLVAEGHQQQCDDTATPKVSFLCQDEPIDFVEFYINDPALAPSHGYYRLI